MSALMNLVNRFAGGAARGRRPVARGRGHTPGGAPGTPRGRGGASAIESTARKLLRRAR